MECSPFSPQAVGPQPPPGPPPRELGGMFGMAKATHPNKEDGQLQQLVNILEAEGVTDRSSLAVLSKQLLEQRLHKCSLGQIADILTMQRKVIDEERGGKRERQQSIRGRSRSPRGRGRRDGSRPLRSGKGKGRGESTDGKPAIEKKDQAPKSRLWEAIENGDEETVQHCIGQGPEEVNSTFKLWTPIMKAAEEGRVTLIQMLTEARADLEAVNAKGRSALSFAATPSMRRASQPDAVRALLTLGADATRRDQKGWTAEDRLLREKPEGFEETTRVFEEFSH